MGIDGDKLGDGEVDDHENLVVDAALVGVCRARRRFCFWLRGGVACYFVEVVEQLAEEDSDQGEGYARSDAADDGGCEGAEVCLGGIAGQEEAGVAREGVDELELLHLGGCCREPDGVVACDLEPQELLAVRPRSGAVQSPSCMKTCWRSGFGRVV